MRPVQPNKLSNDGIKKEGSNMRVLLIAIVCLTFAMVGCNGAMIHDGEGEGGQGGEGGQACLHPTPDAPGEEPIYMVIDECDCTRVGYDYLRTNEGPVDRATEFCVIQNPTDQYCCYFVRPETWK